MSTESPGNIGEVSRSPSLNSSATSKVLAAGEDRRYTRIEFEAVSTSHSSGS